MMNILFTGFVNTDVPKSAIDYVVDNYDNMCIMCTTGINYLNNIPTNKVHKMVMGHYGLVPNFHQGIKSGEIHAVNIPQGIYTNLVAGNYTDIYEKCIESSVGMNTFVEETLGVISPTTSHKDGYITKKNNKLSYTLPNIDMAVVLVDTIDTYGNYILGGCMPLDRQAAIDNESIKGLVIGAYHVVDQLKVEATGCIPLNKIKKVVLEKTPVFEETTTNKKIPPNLESYCEQVASLVKGEVINVGIGGLPELASKVIKTPVTFTVESGCLGGEPCSGKSFGTSKNPDKIFTHAEMFQQYWGGLLDTAILGVGEFTKEGDINVHDFSGNMAGTGGFVDITCSAKRLIFCAKNKKLVGNLSKDKVTFSSKHKKPEQEVFIVTEDKVYKF